MKVVRAYDGLVTPSYLAKLELSDLIPPSRFFCSPGSAPSNILARV